MDGENNGKPYYNGWFAGKTHYFRKHLYRTSNKKQEKDGLVIYQTFMVLLFKLVVSYDCVKSRSIYIKWLLNVIRQLLFISISLFGRKWPTQGIFVETKCCWFWCNTSFVSKPTNNISAYSAIHSDTFQPKGVSGGANFLLMMIYIYNIYIYIWILALSKDELTLTYMNFIPL